MAQDTKLWLKLSDRESPQYTQFHNFCEKWFGKEDIFDFPVARHYFSNGLYKAQVTAPLLFYGSEINF